MIYKIEAAVLIETPRFKSDYAKVIERAGAKLGQRLVDAYEELKKAMQSSQRLPKRFKEHPLRGKRAGKWEVHLLHRGSDYLVEYIKTMENGKMIYTLTRFTKHDRLNAMLQAMVKRLDEFSPEYQDMLNSAKSTVLINIYANKKPPYT